MKAKVIIAQATAETAEALYGLVKKMVDTTAIKAYLENIKSLDPLLYSHLTHQKYIRIK